MKKRDKFWIDRMLWVITIILFSAILSLYNIIQFNNSYMQEEREELEIFRKQIEWVITPYLKDNDIETIKKYCSDFRNEDIKFRIFDENEKLIASSKSYENKELLEEHSNILKRREGKWKIYRHSIKDKMIGLVSKINLENKIYYLELTILEKDVIKSITDAQKNIIIFFSMCIILLLIYMSQFFYTFRKSFNKLEDSVIEIANGNLEAKIETPKINILEELSQSIIKMTQRLKTQIIRLTQLERYKSEFIQNISHEIKTPITAINSAVELLEENKNISAKNRECFAIVKFQLRALNKLVNDILSLSEIEVEKTNSEKHFKMFNINKAIKQVINYTNTGNIKVKITADNEFEIYGDEDLLKTAVSNLLINAIKYSQSDKIDIILKKTGNNLNISVKDYGIGIAGEHLNRIFERFYRIDKTRSRETGGTGLGLSIVKNIIELHNGTVSVKSTLNKGSEFIISIPDSEN